MPCRIDNSSYLPLSGDARTSQFTFPSTESHAIFRNQSQKAAGVSEQYFPPGPQPLKRDPYTVFLSGVLPPRYRLRQNSTMLHDAPRFQNPRSK